MRLRLILSFVLVVLVTLVSVIFFARRGTERAVGDFMVHGGMVSSRDLVESLETYYNQTGIWMGVDRLISGMQGMGQMMEGRGRGLGMMGQRLRIADAEGIYVADSQGSSAGSQMTEAERSLAVPLMDTRGATVGYLVGEGGLGSDASLIGQINQVALQAGLFGGLIALLLGLVLAYSLVRPIHNLDRAARLLAKGDLDQRVPVQGNDELASLGNTFNSMAGSLQEAEKTRRAMTADIAHELRTPLAVQRAQIEALQDGVYPLTLENLQPLVDQNTQLNRLVEDLRTLALAESGDLKLERQPTHLPELVERVLERFRPHTDQRGITVNAEPPASEVCPPLDLDPGRLEQILANLISNALRYTPEGGTIRVQISCDKNNVVLTVRDSGPGIPEEALPHIFERFYRADRSRNRSDGGTGLGLAIARRLSEAMGGELSAANAVEGGAVFSLVFPAH